MKLSGKTISFVEELDTGDYMFVFTDNTRVTISPTYDGVQADTLIEDLIPHSPVSGAIYLQLSPAHASDSALLKALQPRPKSVPKTNIPPLTPEKRKPLWDS